MFGNVFGNIFTPPTTQRTLDTSRISYKEFAYISSYMELLKRLEIITMLDSAKVFAHWYV